MSEYLLNEQIQSESPIYYGLVTAICVLYARPFKRSRGIERLTVQFVPKRFHHLHEQLIMVRDQTAAHVDAQAALYQGRHANNVQILLRDHGRKVTLGVNEVRFNRTAILQIRELADGLVERMIKYIQQAASEYPDDVPDDGDYLINLATGSLEPLDAD